MPPPCRAPTHPRRRERAARTLHPGRTAPGLHASGGYTALFVVAAVLAVAGALAVKPIRGVR
ncbi:hypothetical protein ACIOG8_35020 [Streptomyces erythrochromogenes]|uniref:hypothetical protein n=1 Tax=Streptomyces erythrochromogenes TaxID=285574 RepID=UPI0038111A35